MTLGFAFGAVVAGAVAQWAPHPSLTAYLPNVVMVTVAAAALGASPTKDGVRRRRPATARRCAACAPGRDASS